MDQKDRGTVLLAAAYGPMMAVRLSWSYLHLRRSAVKARKTFYSELMKEGLPKNEADQLADVYSQAVSMTSMMRMLGNSVAFKRR